MPVPTMMAAMTRLKTAFPISIAILEEREGEEYTRTLYIVETGVMDHLNACDVTTYTCTSIKSPHDVLIAQQ